MPDLSILLLQITVILVACQSMGSLFRLIHQPRVVGEMFAGILLGPSMLGSLAPRLSAFIFSPSSLGYLNALSQLGLVIFMFLVGLQISPQELRARSHVAVLTSHASITVPFVLGCGLSLYLYPRLSDASVSFSNFALFMGAAMSITAFPVLAQILRERNMLHSRLGTVALTCAAIDDVTGWCILAYLVLSVRTSLLARPIWLTLAGAVAFFFMMFLVVRRALGRFETMYYKHGRLSESQLGLMLLFALASALCTEWLGIHLLFGAFLAGSIMPKHPGFVEFVRDRFETITVVVLMPLFFAFTGLRMDIGMIKGPEMWLCCVLIILVATLGKLGGSATASLLMGISPREALSLAALMNTRGLMAFVILNVGLNLGIISPVLFSMMVLMALVTTFMAAPLLEIFRVAQPARDGWDGIHHGANANEIPAASRGRTDTL
jgi:Kef-type K+ transport system membrane component KefB